LGVLLEENHQLKAENHRMRINTVKLQGSLEVMNEHNRLKNQKVEELLANRGDYLPVEGERPRKYSAIDRTMESLSPRSHHRLRYL
jgi:hypothetical protein